MIDEEYRLASTGKAKPYCIWHRGDALAYYAATEEERAAWNEYVSAEVEKFDSNPRLDSYDSVRTATGRDRDGKITGWCPPKFFPEWLQERKSKA